MDFSNVKSIIIQEGSVKKIFSNGTVLWEAISYTDLVPTATDKSGAVLDGIGYRRNSYWNGGALATRSQFTAIGLMPIMDGTVQHDIFLYGLNFSGTPYNHYELFSETYSNIAGSVGVKEGYSDTYIKPVTKLADNYFKITTNTYSTRVKYFAISAVTVSGLTPVVTLDEPIF